MWLKRPEHDLTTVRPGAFLKALRKIKLDASRLLDDLSVTSANEKTAVAYEYAIIELGLVGGTLTEQLRALIETADIWEDTTRDRGGRPTDVGFELLIGRLAQLYEEHLGRRAGTSSDRTQGPFFRFVRECRDRFALPLYRQDDALGKAIYRFLKKRRQRLNRDKT
jgi:hypothetical protein